jgi:hypothetical protein
LILVRTIRQHLEERKSIVTCHIDQQLKAPGFEQREETPHNDIARVLVTADVRSLENQSPLLEAFVEFLEPSAQLGLFFIPIGIIL